MLQVGIGRVDAGGPLIIKDGRGDLVIFKIGIAKVVIDFEGVLAIDDDLLVLADCRLVIAIGVGIGGLLKEGMCLLSS